MILFCQVKFNKVLDKFRDVLCFIEANNIGSIIEDEVKKMGLKKIILWFPKINVLKSYDLFFYFIFFIFRSCIWI